MNGPRYTAGSDFDRLFQQRFNELDSLISSDSSPVASGRPRAASSCAPCSSLSAPSQGQTLLQWLALLLLLAGIVVLLVHIIRKMNWRKKGGYGATLLPSVGQQTTGGTIAAKPAGLEPKGSTGGASATEVTNPADIFSSNEAKLVVALFHATWCGHCKELKPVFEAASAQHPDVDFKCVENEVMGKSAEAKKLGVTGFPTVIALKGKKPLGSLIGNQGAAKLHEFIKKMKAM